MTHSALRTGFVATILAGLSVLGSPTHSSAADPISIAKQPERTARNLARWQADALPNRVWVYFTDKGFTDHDQLPDRLRNAELQMAPKAKLRRILRASLGSTPSASNPRSPGPESAHDRDRFLVDYDDLPVAPSYVEALRDLGLTVHQQSRWLNAVSVQAFDRSALAALRSAADLPFVRKLEPVRGGYSDRPLDRDFDLERSPEPGNTHDHEAGIDPNDTHDPGTAIDPPSPDAPSNRDSGGDYGLSYDQLEQINVIEAHDNGLTGAGVWVAVFDTGFYHPHAAFSDAVNEGRLIDQYDFVHNDDETMDEPNDFQGQHNHGTFTWSALGGREAGMFSSPAYGASFILAKTEDLGSETQVEEDNWIAAAEWADQLGADIISSSLNYILWYEYEDMDGDTAPITQAADLCAERGIVVVISAGNQGASDWYYIGAPADGDSVIAVGAVDSANELAVYSSHGPTFDGRTKPEVVALGVDTYCATPPNFGADYWWISGTSLSCPLVAGGAALILEANPTWTPGDVRAALLQTADNSDNPDNDRGWGLIDVWTALNEPISVDGMDDIDGPGESDFQARSYLSLQATPNPGTDRVQLQLNRSVAGPVRLTIYDPGGREVFQRDATDRELWEWTGRDDSGRKVPAGVYLARVATSEGAAVSRITLTR